MWTATARPNPRDAHTPGPTEIGLTVAAAYEAGDTIDTPSNALRSTDLDSFLLASLRTDADEAAAEAALDTALTAPAAEVVNLPARRRRATPNPERGELRAA